jgi:hypothetical protein
MRTICGVGTPRSLQGRVVVLFATLWSLLWHPETVVTIIWSPNEAPTGPIDLQSPRHVYGINLPLERAFATGC